jgi:hypothetical protein
MNRLFVLALLLLATTTFLHAQKITIYPDSLFSSDNEITITAPNGIKNVTVTATGKITRVEGDGPGSCEKERKLKVFVNTASEAVRLNIVVIDCKNKRKTFALPLHTVWNLDLNNLGQVEVGTTVCHDFFIRSSGTGEWLDNITVPDPHLSLKLPTSLPVFLPGGETYTYQVCFKADEPGVYVFPSITWMRRSQPSAGMTSYPVSDTGMIEVILPPPPPDTVIPQRLDTVRRDTIRRDPPPVREPEISDPTIFRSVGVPNAVIPKKGKLYVGSYDLLGLTAGYSLDDRLMLIVGGAIPTPDDWAGIHSEIFGAWSIGVKLGLQLDSLVHLAVGYQYGTSIYDKAITPERESEITLSAPYIVGSYGDDDSRVSLTLGHAFKNHRTFYPPYRNFSEFKRNAWLGALGGDYRFARHWKVAGEVAYMQTAGVLPVIATVRYFSRTWAVDVGVAYVGITLEGGTPPVIPVLPVVSAVFVF